MENKRPDDSRTTLKFAFNETNSDQLLGEVIIYVAWACENDPAFGATKLNKILYFADFLAYAKYGQPITGASYKRLQNGPAPATLVQTRQAMIEAGDIVLQPREFFGHPQQRVVPLRPPKFDMLKASDIDILQHVIQLFADQNGTDLSMLSHQQKAWQIAETGELIPYNSIFLDSAELTEEDITISLKMSEECGW
jgi:uncharacterized phage-associated protein